MFVNKKSFVRRTILKIKEKKGVHDSLIFPKSQGSI